MEEKNSFDMKRVMAQAMELSKVLNGGQEKSSNEDSINSENNSSMESMLKIMEIVSLIGNTMSKSESAQESEEVPSVFLGEEFSKNVAYFEDDINTPAIKTIKSALPYLDYKYQKNIGVAVKLIEIQRILDKYSSVVVNMEITKNKNWRKNMILAIRPHMEEEKRQMIDMLINFMDMKDILDRLQNKNEEDE